MKQSEPPIIETEARGKPIALHPSFLGALWGAWLFTWRSRLTLKRMPFLGLLLLLLPAVVYLTTLTPEGWRKRHTLQGNPYLEEGALRKRLARLHLELEPRQHTEMLSIFREEYGKAEEAWQTRQEGEEDGGEGREAISKACFDRVKTRAQTVLDESQFKELEKFTAQRTITHEDQTSRRLWNRQAIFYRWLIDFYFFVLLPLVCIGGCGPLIREESQADTLGFLTTRPLSRARLVLVKFLSQAAWLQIIFLIEAALLFVVGALRNIPEVGHLTLLFFCAQILAVLAWCGLGTALGLITKKYMAIGIMYGMVVENGIGRIPTNINTLSVMRHLKSLLGHNAALQTIYEWPVRSVTACMLALLMAVFVFLAVAAFMFTTREYHHTAEMQK